MFEIVAPRKVLLFFELGILVFYVGGCGISRRTTTPGENTGTPAPRENIQARNDQPENNMPEPTPLAMKVSSSYENISDIRKQLQNAYQQWKGTPYVYGGEGSNGVDCSAFTQTVFNDFFDKKLPRDTRSQLQIGRGVRRRSIRTGDLIFFKTGSKTLHVGIAMGDGNFLHASASSGVMISNIGERYWAVRYLGARRVL